jgi:putative oxidoreductase
MEAREPLIYVLIRWVIALFFIVAGAMKWGDPASFQQSILAYQVLDYPTSFVVAHFLPSLEIMLGIGLILKRSRVPALWLMGSLLLVFVVLLSWTWWLGIDVDCGCLGPIDWVEGQPAAIVRDLVLIAGIVVLYRKEQQRLSRYEV